MTLQKKRKASKSEVILNMLDSNERKNAVEWMRSHRNVKIPRSYLTDEEAESLRSDKAGSLKSEKTGSLRRAPATETPFDPREFVELCYNRRKAWIERMLPKLPEFPRDLRFTDPNMQIFYLSLILRQHHDAKVEANLLTLLRSRYMEGRDLSFLRHCILKFSKRALAAFLQCNICDLKSVCSFLGFLAPKVQPNVIEIWFEGDFGFADELFRRMNVMRLRKDIPFKDSVFTHLLQFKAFRNAVFNGNMGKQFVIDMKSYANRGDYAYFYDLAGITRRLDESCSVKPRDHQEFSFFSDFNRDSAGDLHKIRNYQTRIGHTFILNMFANRHIPDLCELARMCEAGREIMAEVVAFNSDVIRDFEKGAADLQSYQESKAANDEAFEILKRDEDVLEALIKHFYKPKEQALQHLITGVFDLTIKEASDYINMGYEDALVKFFKAQPMGDVVKLIDAWNCNFFLKLFSQMSLSVEDALLLSEFIQGTHLVLNEKHVALIYDRIMNVPDPRIFARLPDSLRIIYAIRHEMYQHNLISELVKRLPDLTASAWIYELVSLNPQLRAEVSALRTSNSAYRNEISMSEDVILDTGDIINSLFVNTFVLREDAFYLFVRHFDLIVDQILKVLSKEDITKMSDVSYDFRRHFLWKSSGMERIIASLGKDSDLRDFQEKISFIMSYNLSNRYLCYAVFDRLLHFLTDGTSSQKILILLFVKPAILIKGHIMAFINALISLLNSSNSTVCRLSKIKFNQILVETKEIQNILPEIVQTFLDRNNFGNFLKSFRAIQFNNYLCFNSLNILLQLLLRSLNEYPADCFDILKRIIHIIKDKDMKYVYGILLNSISLFVVNNNHSTSEAFDVAAQFCMHATLSDFSILLANLKSLRISNFLIDVLKIKGDSALNDQVICHVLARAKADDGRVGSVEPAFIAAASRLREFSRHLNVFLPLLKQLFVSEKLEERQIASRALKSIMSSPELDEYKQAIDDYVVDCCIHRDYPVRLQSLDITRSLSIIFILRHDQHSLVKKRAHEVWKERVINTNKELKTLFGDILGFIRERAVKVFCIALKETVCEFAVKYPLFLETYAKGETDDTIREFIFIEAAKHGKLLHQAADFCKSHFSPELFNILSRTPLLRDEIIPTIDKDVLCELCAVNSDLALYLFNKTGDPLFIDFTSPAQKLDILKAHHQTSSTVTSADGNIILILQGIESSPAVEEFLLKAHPSFSYYYVSVLRSDHGKLHRIFKRVFDSCSALEDLVKEANLEYLKSCTYDRVRDKQRLILLLITRYERAYFEKAIGLIKGTDLRFETQNDFFAVLGYLFRNLLLENRRDSCTDCISEIYRKQKHEMGYFKVLAETNIPRLG